MPNSRRTVTGLRPLSDLPSFATDARFLVEPTTRFFDDILVMADDEGLRAARLGLLASVLALAPAGLDWKAVDAATS